MSWSWWHHTSEETSPKGRRSSMMVDRDGVTVLSARFERYWGRHARNSPGFGIEENEDTAGWRVYVGFPRAFCGWLTAGSPWWSQRRYKKHGYQYRPDMTVVSLRFHDRAVWWEAWHPTHEWHRGTPWWRYGSFNVWDWLVGKTTYTSETLFEQRAVLPMPEGNYPVVVKVGRSVWTRPRWRAMVRAGYHVDVEGGYVPVPGKGENSYDCGPDGVFSQSGPILHVPELLRNGPVTEASKDAAVSEALAGLMASALETRRRRGVSENYAEPIS